jgi:hypothetical protein
MESAAPRSIELRILIPEPFKQQIRMRIRGEPAMISRHNRSKAIAISIASLPIGLFAAYVAYLIVPEVLRIVVPTVVESVLTK